MRLSTEKLIEATKSASKKAHAPYSNFAVGCVIASESGQIYTGCNVENASLGLTICAERTAAAKGVSEEGSDFRISLVVIYTPTEKPVSPCGACRQFLSEFGSEFEILSVCDGKEKIKQSMKQLLPKPSDLQFYSK